MYAGGEVMMQGVDGVDGVEGGRDERNERTVRRWTISYIAEILFGGATRTYVLCVIKNDIRG